MAPHDDQHDDQSALLRFLRQPASYGAVHCITRAHDGQLQFDGAGTLVDALIEMQRFDQACELARTAATVLASGAPVLANAVFDQAAHRSLIEAAARQGGPSDATLAVLAQQLRARMRHAIGPGSMPVGRCPMSWMH